MRKPKPVGMKAGIWIDHKKAVVILITDKSEETRRIRAESDETRTPPRGLRSKNKYGPRDYVAEDRRDRKFMDQLNRYYGRIVASLDGAESILILGPGEAKGEFKKRISRQKMRRQIAQLETADKMTDRQIAANVRRHFAPKPDKPTKSARSRKSLPKSMSPNPGRVPHDLGGEA